MATLVVHTHSHTSGDVLTAQPTLVANGFQGLEEEGKVDLPLLVRLVTSRDLPQLNVACKTTTLTLKPRKSCCRGLTDSNFAQLE